MFQLLVYLQLSSLHKFYFVSIVQYRGEVKRPGEGTCYSSLGVFRFSLCVNNASLTGCIMLGSFKHWTQIVEHWKINPFCLINDQLYSFILIVVESPISVYTTRGQTATTGHCMILHSMSLTVNDTYACSSMEDCNGLVLNK